MLSLAAGLMVSQHMASLVFSGHTCIVKHCVGQFVVCGLMFFPGSVYTICPFSNGSEAPRLWAPDGCCVLGTEFLCVLCVQGFVLCCLLVNLVSGDSLSTV